MIFKINLPKKDTTVNNNKLVAEFMGLQTISVDDFNKLPNAITIKVGDYSIIEYQKYHTSWDWLMPVVEKINLLDDYTYTVYMASMDTRIENNHTGETIVETSCENDVDQLKQSVYNTVIKFITWYNEQNK